MTTAPACRKKCCGINVIVSGRAGFSPYSQGHDRLEIESVFCVRGAAQMLAPQHRSGALWISNSDPFFEERDRT
jgi:hypothetical protein